ncbi:hypothetical protein GCM10022224_078840 [Nonomuraea antimicrobica]|uniref:VOC domain-containing protein n=1 Tax=Nonomuraea antimicrobica TaxID=561173 RepID=A0ABP7D5Y2_9ACTN
MEIAGVTIELPVSDLARAMEWYGQVFDLGGPDLEPAEGAVDYFEFGDPDGNRLSVSSEL